MPSIIPDQEENLPLRDADGVQGVLGELEEKAAQTPPRRDDEKTMQHTGQITRDTYRD